MSTKLLHRSRQLTALLLVLLLAGSVRAGITVVGADGTHYSADSIVFHQPNGISLTHSTAARLVRPDGVDTPAADAIDAADCDGITVVGADGITVVGADGITVVGADGRTFNIAPNGITVVGADNIAIVEPNGITVVGADGI